MQFPITHGIYVWQSHQSRLQHAKLQPPVSEAVRLGRSYWHSTNCIPYNIVPRLQLSAPLLLLIKHDCCPQVTSQVHDSNVPVAGRPAKLRQTTAIHMQGQNPDGTKNTTRGIGPKSGSPVDSQPASLRPSLSPVDGGRNSKKDAQRVSQTLSRSRDNMKHDQGLSAGQSSIPPAVRAVTPSGHSEIPTQGQMGKGFRPASAAALVAAPVNSLQPDRPSHDGPHGASHGPPHKVKRDAIRAKSSNAPSGLDTQGQLRQQAGNLPATATAGM